MREGKTNCASLAGGAAKLNQCTFGAATKIGLVCDTARTGADEDGCGGLGLGVQHGVAQSVQQHLASPPVPQANGSAVATLCATTSSTLNTMANAVFTAEV